MSQPEFITLTDEQVKARKRRNIAIAFGLLVFIATVYAITVSRMHANNQARQAQIAAENVAAGVVVSDPVVADSPATPTTEQP
ncbi:hypothetical protein [Brevundimonas sp.]|uniref:hypothetical protein n=1 Tax=Brevundimonas sp. TaxID=1871086 RepID=UPI002FC87E11